MAPIPDELHGRVFNAAEAAALGVTPRALRGRRFVMLQRGTFCTSETPRSLLLEIEAARRVLPPEAAVSHLTNLRLRGFEVGPVKPLHFSTSQTGKLRRPGVVVHRRQGQLNPTEVCGVPALGVLRTFVDAATLLNDRNLLRVGDWLAAHQDLDVAALRAYVADSHLNGVARARRVAAMVRDGVASPRESDLRWYLARARLPEPALNRDIFDERGGWLACGDLVFFPWKVLVEYDGWQHERDARQRQWDHLRREQLERAGWRVIVVTSADMHKPDLVVWRVRDALRQRGANLR